MFCRTEPAVQVSPWIQTSKQPHSQATSSAFQIKKKVACNLSNAPVTLLTN